jgi:predicted tellurium resistance membrane protein TerC
MSNATKRAILRWIHLTLAIPIIGYVYSPFAELPNYAPIVRYLAFPVVLLSGLWMYAGVIFAFIGVAVWLGAYQLFGMGPAILSLIALLIARKIWLVVRARRLKGSANKALLGRNQDVGAIRNTR